jgi:hypothetical protein
MVFSLAKALPLFRQWRSEQVLVLYGDIAYKDSHLLALIEAKPQAKMWVQGNTQWFELWSQRLDDPLTDTETFTFDEPLR